MLSCKARLPCLLVYYQNLKKLQGDFVWRIDYIKYCISISLLYRESNKYINLLARNTRRYQRLFLVFLLQPTLSNRFTSSFRFLNCATEINFPLFHLFNAVTSANMCVYPRHEFGRDIAWRVRHLRTKDAHKQLARTSLNISSLSELSDSAMMQIHEHCTSLEAWHKEVIIPKCTGHESKVSNS